MVDDPAALREALADPDEDVRADAALRLADQGDPYALEALVLTLDDGGGPNHVDITPAVGRLAEIGERALPALVAPLRSQDELTRLHAQRAIEGVIHRRHGFRPGQGFPGADEEEATRADLQAIGYSYDAEPDAREAAVERLVGALDEDGQAD